MSALIEAFVELHREQIEERFWAKVDRRGEDDCWMWKSERDYYGKVTLPKSRIQIDSHKMAYILSNGVVPPLMVVRHTCDVKRCCNPKHLIVGTAHDNILDMVERNLNAKGTGINCAKLNDDLVRDIRRKVAHGATVYALAKHYEVNKGTIARIVRGEGWKHVD